MQADWDDLKRELDLWVKAGRVAELWWRDDDATELSPALERLLGLAAEYGVEVGLAIIPAGASESLAGALARRSDVAALQHGYRHRNHAPPGAPAVECGGARSVDDVLDDLRAGYRRMEQLFPSCFEPVLAAPWNRIERPVLERLASAGYRVASAMGPRARMATADGLVVVNAHLDPLNWKERRFAGLPKALCGVIEELRARRSGANEPHEPIGLLTHHLDHDEPTWAFLAQLLEVTRAHPGARWLGAREVLGQRAAEPAILNGAR